MYKVSIIPTDIASLLTTGIFFLVKKKVTDKLLQIRVSQTIFMATEIVSH